MEKNRKKASLFKKSPKTRTKTNKFTVDKTYKSILINEEKLSNTKFFEVLPKEKIYSRSIVISYKPLSEKEKINTIEDISKSSNLRLKEYAGLFNEIKHHLNEISGELTKDNKVQFRVPKRIGTTKEKPKLNMNILGKENQIDYDLVINLIYL